MKITLDLLIEHKACEEQRELFAQTFPRGATVNTHNLAKALKAGLYVLWMENLLTKAQREDYMAKREPLYEDYYAKRKPLDADYMAKRKALDEDYEAKRKPLDEDYRAKCKPLDEDYLAGCKPLDEDYWAKLSKLLITYFKE